MGDNQSRVATWEQFQAGSCKPSFAASLLLGLSPVVQDVMVFWQPKQVGTSEEP